MFVLLPKTTKLHRATVTDCGGKRTVATLCGLQAIFGNSNRKGGGAERPRVFPNHPAQAVTSGEFQLCAACEQQKDRYSERPRHKERREELNVETPSVTFQPNEFYERLILLRTTNPTRLARFSGATLAALQAYEVAKLNAKLEEMKRHQQQAGKKKGSKQ
jgi:hypothetical protein